MFDHLWTGHPKASASLPAVSSESCQSYADPETWHHRWRQRMRWEPNSGYKASPKTVQETVHFPQMAIYPVVKGFYFVLVFLNVVLKYYLYYLYVQCTSGCGKGYMRRNIKCMVDKQVVADDKCQIHQKPKKLAQCDSKVDCEWREDPWRNVSINIRIVMDI